MRTLRSLLLRDLSVKKIYVNGKFFSQPVTGTQRYGRELLNQFDRLLSTQEYKDIAVEILIPKNAKDLPEYAKLEVRTVGSMTGTKWEQLELPRYCHGNILFTLSGGAPILHSRNVVTIHDAAVVAAPGGYSLAYRLWHRSICRHMAKTAEHIFTVSNFSKSEIVKWYSANPEKISAIYVGSHFPSLKADATALSRFGVPERYVLAIGAYNPNKNLARVVEAMGYLKSEGLQLVIVGGHDKSVYRQSGELPAGVRTLGYVSDIELKALYKNAACFVFPSLYEGFGSPALEAISSGCPLVASRISSLPELFDGAAVFCDPYNPEDIARAIRAAAKSSFTIADKLKAFSKKFSWETCARETLSVFKQL
jgi:glycosyltransferase involved in cell wall biosynthesis